MNGILNNSFFRELYAQTDLTFTYVSSMCLELVVKKGCKITDEQIIVWFREMLKEKWTVKIFNQQLEVIKNLKRWGDTLDWQMWIQTERMYSEHELNRKIAEAVNNKLNTGRRLSAVLEENGREVLLKLTDTEKEALALQAVQEFMQEITRERGRLAEEFIHQEKVKQRTQLSELKKYLRDLNGDVKKRLLALMLENEILKGSFEDWDKEHYLNEFHLFYPEIKKLEELLKDSIKNVVNNL